MFWKKFRSFFVSVGKGIRTAGAFCFKYRKIFLSVPVLVCAVYLLQYNLGHLPARVGLLLNSQGGFSWMVSRKAAVWFPFGISMLCLGMMWLSKKTFYPWLVSMVTMFLPVMICFINTFRLI